MAPFFDPETLGVLNAYILPSSRNIGGAIVSPAPPLPPPLKNNVKNVKNWVIPWQKRTSTPTVLNSNGGVVEHCVNYDTLKNLTN